MCLREYFAAPVTSVFGPIAVPSIQSQRLHSSFSHSSPPLHSTSLSSHGQPNVMGSETGREEGRGEEKQKREGGREGGKGEMNEGGRE